MQPRVPSAPQCVPARSLRIALLGYRSAPYGGGQGVYIRYLSKALVDAGHRVDVISGPPYPHLDPRVNLIELPSLDLFENGLLSLRPHHLRSMSNVIEWTSKLTGGFAEPYTFGRRAVKLDVKGFSREKDEFTDIGEGDLPWAEVRQALDDIGFSGWATVEVKGGDVDRLTTVYQQMKKALIG